MAIPPNIQEALFRLTQYNSEPVSADNPYGFGNYGNITNFPRALDDHALVGEWVANASGDTASDVEAAQIARAGAEAAAALALAHEFNANAQAEAATASADAASISSGAALASANRSEAKADEAAGSATAASGSAQAASQSETAANTSASNAATSAGTATTQAGEAAGSAQAASDDAADARLSRDAAGGSASSAAQSEATALTHSSNSQQSALHSYLWSSAAFNVPVDDGDHQGFSAYHWSLVAATAAGGGIVSINGKTGTNVTLDAADVGLGNVDNTSDAAKPVSTATQTALDGKATTAQGEKADTALQSLTAGTNVTITGTGTSRTINATSAPQVQADWNATSGLGQILNKPTLGTAAAQDVGAFATAAQGTKADTAVQPAGLTKAAVGLGNVDNTSDVNKPVSTLQQTALDGKANLVGGKVPLGELPDLTVPDASTTVKGKVQLATVADVRAASTGDKAIVAECLKDAAALVTITDAATITLDWTNFVVGNVALAGNRVLGNPTNIIPGTTRYLYVRGNNATERTLSFGSNFKGDLPSDAVSSTKWLLFGLIAYSATHINVTSLKAL